jgi:hypothetical protein
MTKAIFIILLILSVSTACKKNSAANTNSAMPNEAANVNSVSSDYEQRMRAFKNYGARFVSELPPKRGGAAYLKGKAVVLQLDHSEGSKGWGYDPWLNEQLPDQDRAARPEEIVTVVLVDTAGRSKVGQYSDGADALIQIWTVSVIDTTIPAIVGERTFRGNQPREQKTDRLSPGIGSSPNGAVAEYIKRLPRR